jgi:hypothetical protein
LHLFSRKSKIANPKLAPFDMLRALSELEGYQFLIIALRFTFHPSGSPGNPGRSRQDIRWNLPILDFRYFDLAQYRFWNLDSQLPD